MSITVIPDIVNDMISVIVSRVEDDNPRQNNLFFTSFQQPSFAKIVNFDSYIDDWSSFFALLSTNHTPLGLVVGSFDFVIFMSILSTNKYYFVCTSIVSLIETIDFLPFTDISSVNDYLLFISINTV